MTTNRTGDTVTAVRTKRGAVRRYNSIIAKCYRDMRGGCQYGIDWPTLRATWPDRAAEIKHLRDIYRSLPE